jgi:hypothetical protein
MQKSGTDMQIALLESEKLGGVAQNHISNLAFF